MSSPSDQPTNRRRIGSRFESLAADYFAREGYTILERNWQTGHKEIDLIVKKDALVVFVEVKAAKSDSFGHPVERVNRTKRARLLQAARQYSQDPRLGGCDFRFDVITFLDGQLEHFPDAFRDE